MANETQRRRNRYCSWTCSKLKRDQTCTISVIQEKPGDRRKDQHSNCSVLPSIHGLFKNKSHHVRCACRQSACHCTPGSRGTISAPGSRGGTEVSGVRCVTPWARSQALWLEHHFQVVHLPHMTSIHPWKSSQHLTQTQKHPALSKYWRFPRLIYFWSKV